MKNKFVLCLIFMVSLPACADIVYHRPNYYHHPYNPQRFRVHDSYRGLRNGVLTGFSPSVVPYYNNGIYTYNDGVLQKTYTTSGKFSWIKNWFNRTVNPYYSYNQLPVNPYVNGNYNTNQNKKAIQLFDSGKPVNSFTDPYGNDISGGVNTGCSVTIIE